VAKKVFISYDYDNDRASKNLLLAWNAHKEFDFSIEDHSADISINSHDAAAIKRAISAKMGNVEVVLVLVGKYTSKSQWVTWEIEKALELKKKIVAVKLDSTNISPAALTGVRASWAMSFTLVSIKKAIG
jgi:hypothetical protein